MDTTQLLKGVLDLAVLAVHFQPEARLFQEGHSIA